MTLNLSRKIITKKLKSDSSIIFQETFLIMQEIKK